MKFGRILSGLGLLAVLFLFWPVGLLTFKGSDYALEMLLAGLAVPCLIATSMWSALLQSHGQIKSLARVQIISGLVGLALGLPLIWFFGLIGIAASVLLAAAVPAVVTWRAACPYCQFPADAASSSDIRTLVRLGAALMAVAVLGQLSAYVVRLILIRSHGLEAAGYYQAAFAIAGSLPGFVFTAMGTDFFPRVAGVKTEAEAQELCEKQIQAGLLLALPLIAGLLTLGQVCIHLLYARSFDPAIPLLSWMIWGIFLRLLSWPMGYWLLARGSSRAVIIVESTASIIAALLPLLLVPIYGVTGAAIGFFVGYVAYATIMLAASRKRSGRWLSLKTLGWFLLCAGFLGFSQVAVTLFEGPYWGLVPTGTAAIICAWIYFRALRGESSAI
jgi:PST family polysaccharide transporter